MNKIILKVWPDATFGIDNVGRMCASVTFGKRHSAASITRDIQTIRNRVERKHGYVPQDFYGYTENDRTVTITWTPPKN